MARPHVLSALFLLLASSLAAQSKQGVSEVSAGAPKPATKMQAGAWKYQVNVDAGGQSISIKRSTTVTEAPDGWTIVDTVETPGGAVTDTATLDKTTLVPRRRKLTQGSATFSLELAGDKATGAMDMNGKTTPLAVDLGGPLFADGPGAAQAIACLPLAEGYRTTFRNLDLPKQKVNVMQLSVAGSDNVTVPAGTFDAFRVEITGEGDSKMTLWIAKQSRAVLKIVTSAPGAAGLKMTAELAP